MYERILKSLKIRCPNNTLQLCCCSSMPCHRRGEVDDENRVGWRPIWDAEVECNAIWICGTGRIAKREFGERTNGL